MRREATASYWQVDVIRISMKYFLFLSFFLAFLPGQKTHDGAVAKSKEFVAVVDHVKTLAPAEHGKKNDSEIEDLVPVIQGSLVLLQPDSVVSHFRIPSFKSDPLALYAIRGPPSFSAEI